MIVGLFLRVKVPDIAKGRECVAAAAAARAIQFEHKSRAAVKEGVRARVGCTAVSLQRGRMKFANTHNVHFTFYPINVPGTEYSYSS